MTTQLKLQPEAAAELDAAIADINIFEGEAEKPEARQPELEEKIQAPVESAEEIEARAIAYGWKPEYDGPNKKTAEEFLKLGEERAPILKQRNKKLEQENETLRKSYSTLMEQTAANVKKILADNEARLETIKTEKAEARENLDVQKMENLASEEAKLKIENNNIQSAAPPIDPTVQLWAQENADFVRKVGADPVMRTYSDSWAFQNVEYLKTLPPAERFQKVMEHMHEAFPGKFANPNQAQAPRTQPTNRTPSMQKPLETKLTISTLPKPAKDAYDLVVKAMRFKTPEERKEYDVRFLEEYKLSTGHKE